MKIIEVLGSGCKSCHKTAELIRQVCDECGINIDLQLITDITQIAGRGVLSTPAVVINGQIVHFGGVPSKSQIQNWLKN